MARAPTASAEEAPAHDPLDGFPPPRAAAHLIGHTVAERALLDAYRSGRMHHAWLITGQRGIGKATLAFRLSRFILQHPDPRDPSVTAAGDLAVDPADPIARKIAAGSHPNVIHLEREWDERSKRHRTEISVDAVRRLIPFLGTTAGEGVWRFVIVDPADDLNRSAANAILKALEEPPPRTLFLLTCDAPGRLLPTIRSRCRLLQLDSLRPDMLAAAVVAAGDSGSIRKDDLALTLAEGSVRRLIELSHGGGVELYRLMLEVLGGAPRQGAHKLADAAADHRSGAFARFLDLLSGYVHRRVRAEPEPEASHRPPALPLVTWAELWEKAAASAREVETFNLDRKQFVLDLVENIAAASLDAGRTARR